MTTTNIFILKQQYWKLPSIGSSTSLLQIMKQSAQSNLFTLFMVALSCGKVFGTGCCLWCWLHWLVETRCCAHNLPRDLLAIKKKEGKISCFV